MENEKEVIEISKKRNFSFKYIILFVILISIVGFFIQNNNELKIKALVWEIETSLIMLLFIFFISGILTSFFLIAPIFSNSARKNKQITNLTQKISELELKLKNEKF